MNFLILTITMLFLNQTCTANETINRRDYYHDENSSTSSIYNFYSNPQFHNIYNPQTFHDTHSCNMPNTFTQAPSQSPITQPAHPCHQHNPCNPHQPCPPNENPIEGKILVKKSSNTIDLSENYILDVDSQADLSSKYLLTRIESNIIGAPTGPTDVMTLTLETDLHITSTVEFIGQTAINGNGNILYLDAGGSLQIDGLSNLVIKNVTIKGIGGQNIFCVDDTARLNLQNVRWIQESDFTFQFGILDISDNLHCIGNGYSFNYTSTKECTIHTGATMTLDYNFNFKYAPNNGVDNLLIFEDQSAAITLINASFQADNIDGLTLKKGIFFIDGQSSFNGGSGAGISIGDGTAENDTIFLFYSGAILQLNYGTLTYNNVLDTSWNMRDTNAILRINPSTTFNLLQTIHLGFGALHLSTSASFYTAPGASIDGSVSFF